MKINNEKDMFEELKKALQQIREELIEEEKKKDGYLVISDKDGNVIKVPARDL